MVNLSLAKDRRFFTSGLLYCYREPFFKLSKPAKFWYIPQTYRKLFISHIFPISGEGVNALGKIAINTTICATGSAIAVTLLTLYKEKHIEPYSVVNGICTGLCHW